MEAFFEKLAQEAPNLAAIIVVVYIFVKANERIAKDFAETIKTRDGLFLDMMQNLTSKLDAIDLRHAEHAKEMTEGMKAMHRASGTKKRRLTDKK